MCFGELGFVWLMRNERRGWENWVLGFTSFVVLCDVSLWNFAFNCESFGHWVLIASWENKGKFGIIDFWSTWVLFCIFLIFSLSYRLFW